MLRRPLGDVAVRLFGHVAKPCRAWNILVRSFIITACAGEIISLSLLKKVGQHTVLYGVTVRPLLFESPVGERHQSIHQDSLHDLDHEFEIKLFFSQIPSRYKYQQLSK